jgi:glycosyltransferase involved in cell wall biosynthesis
VKKVATVAGHFVPSNLTAVHRSRLWTYHLKDFGWEPIIVTTHWDYYEEPTAPELSELVPDDLRVLRTKALPTKPVRLVGSIGIRAFYWHYRALCDLAERDEIDFIHITIPSFYSALLGRLVHRKYEIPYGIDYIDPWVHDFPVPDVPLGRLKSWASTHLAEILEPWAVRDAALITGVAESYYEDVLERNPHLKQQAVTAAMPYGGAKRDHEALRESPRELFLWPEKDDRFHMLYAGAMLPKAYPVLEVTLQALAQLQSEDPDLMERYRLHFVGTGTSPDGPEGHNVLPVAQEYGVTDLVTEHPDRISYLDVLNHLQVADAAYVMGTTERHYTPSKTYQAVLSESPIWAILHEASSATDVIRKSRTGRVVDFSDRGVPSAGDVADSLQSFLTEYEYDPDQVEWDMFEQYSARETTRVLADALDEAHARVRSN